MGRSKAHTRRTPKARPRGILELAPDGFGFVSTAEGEFFIPASKVCGAFDGDLVEIAPARNGAGGASREGKAGRPSARVLRVLERAHDTLVGRYEVADPFGVVVPQDARIPYDVFTMRADNPDIPHGAIVRVRMVEYPSRNTAATGVVEEVLGMDGAPGMDVAAIVARHRLETRFADAALKQAAEAQVDTDGALAAGYADLRDRFCFTIDPFDARDFDDAVSCSAVLPNSGQVDAAASAGSQSAAASGGSPTEVGYAPYGDAIAGASETLADSSTASRSHVVLAGSSCRSEERSDESSRARWRLGVHIADVSHYVPWGSAVDVDARKRATSVYLVDRVLPMLPEALSNEVCSLKPGQPRRTFTVDIVLSDAFEVLSVDCYPSVIESKARLSYDQAQCYIDASLRGQAWPEASEAVDGQPVPQGAQPIDDAAHEQLFDALALLNRFAQARAKKREVAGGIDFETTEAKVQLDEQGHPLDVIVRTRTAATSCIEEAMILANECVAKRLNDTSTPGLFRVHDAPTADSLATVVPVLQEFGYDKHVDLAAFIAGDPAALQAVLARAHGRPEAGLVSALLLRAQQRAAYKTECLGHYGLASQAYCHFTSPIRRYPDLVVHRMLRTLIQGKGETYTQECDSLPWLAEHSSKMERVAEVAARQSQELKLAEYMEQFVGQEFDGIVSGVATYGLFVQLANTAEGLVPVRTIGAEYYSFDPASYRLIGQDSGRVYRLGQQVRIRIAPTPEHSRKLEFRLVED